ncbi:MAG: hypothetical protein M0Z45_01225 [Actinomycetota bacterium]|nr:hypothetical protein [Actinomycetota bacterium]
MKITTVNEAIGQDYSRPNVVIEIDPPRTLYLTEAGVEEDQVSEIAFDNLRDNPATDSRASNQLRNHADVHGDMHRQI